MRLLAAVVLLSLAVLATQPRATLAQGGGVNLSWDDCGAAGQLNKDFACAADTGVSVLVASLSLDAGSSGITPYYIESVFLFLFSGQVPSWWALQAGGCRAGAFSIHADEAGVAGCMNYWESHNGRVIGYSWSIFDRGLGPEGYRLRMGVGTVRDSAETLYGPHQLLAGRIVIHHQKTVGPDSCGGCSIKGGFTILNGSVYSPEYVSTGFTNPNHRNYVLWQDGLVPTRRTTWGTVKALYR